MTDDWAEDANMKAFPRAKNTYFIQLVEEPVLVTKEGQWGPFTTLSVSIQMFAMGDDKSFEYVGPVQFKGKSCVFADFTFHNDHLLDTLFKVEGFKHGQHVDLEIKKTFPRQIPRALPSTDEDAPKPAPAQQEMEVIPSQASPPVPPTYPSTEPPKCPKCQQPCTEFMGKWVHCGVEVVPSG